MYNNVWRHIATYRNNNNNNHKRSFKLRRTKDRNKKKCCKSLCGIFKDPTRFAEMSLGKCRLTLVYCTPESNDKKQKQKQQQSKKWQYFYTFTSYLKGVLPVCSSCQNVKKKYPFMHAWWKWQCHMPLAVTAVTLLCRI